MGIDQLKELPSKKSSEEALIGIVLDHQQYFYDVKTKSEFFYNTRYKKVWSIIERLKKDGKFVDHVTVQGELGEGEDLYEMFSNLYSPSNLKTYEEDIRNGFVQRSIINSMRSVMVDCYEGKDISKILTKISHATDFGTINGSKKLSDCVIDIASNIGSNKQFIAQYGYKHLDVVLGGYMEGQLIIIGARPGIGKTLVGCNLIDNLTIAGVPACFFTLEMTATEIAKRIVSKWTGISMRALDSDVRSVDTVNEKAGEKLESGYDFEIIDELFDYTNISIEIKRQVIKNNCKVVFIDYLGLIDYADGGKNDNTLFAISQITKGFKRLAKEMGIAIVLLSQLNRDGANGKPTKAQLRSSGSIEQDADVVILLYQDSENEAHKKYVNFIIDKNRNGQEKSIFLGVDKSTMKIYDVDQKECVHL